MQKPTRAMKRAANARLVRTTVYSIHANTARKSQACANDVVYAVDASARPFQVDIMKLDAKELGLVVARRNVEYAIERVRRNFAR